jgi:GNAT superfamily N-acetyltransferase
MSHELEIHAASPDELAAAHRNVFDIWSKGLSIDDHVRSRVNSGKHRLAEWFVGCMDARVVVSLGCYPLKFHLRGDIVPGIAIGSVYTVAEFRRRGLAARLLAWVEERKRGEGAALSLLYSDIAAEYYARLGYLLCPSLSGWRATSDAPASGGASHRLVEISAADNLDRLATLYRGYHGAMPLAIARDRGYWAALLQRFEADRFFALKDTGGNWAGYARLGRQGDDVYLRDYALADRSDRLAESLYAAALTFGREEGAKRVGGWLPDTAAAGKWFELAPRQAEISMIKPLVESAALDDALLSCTSYFCEIDHV